MERPAVKSIHRSSRELRESECGAAASEYAAILAMVVITVIVSLMVWGRNVSAVVGNVRGTLASSGSDVGTGPGHGNKRGGPSGGARAQGASSAAKALGLGGPERSPGTGPAYRLGATKVGHRVGKGGHPGRGGR